MTPPTRQTTTRSRVPLAFLAAIVAVLATLLSSATASAATNPRAENRVRASTQESTVAAAVSERITAGQQLEKAPDLPGFVVATGVATNAERVAINGETTATRLGRQMHQERDYGPGYVKEFTLRAGGRPDAINFETRHIFELKPNNPMPMKDWPR